MLEDELQCRTLGLDRWGYLDPEDLSDPIQVSRAAVSIR
jgi:hypothetical protein